jgi:predicted nuclease of predicted toxin-antitoxin system
LRLFADSNITAPAVKAMRETGFDVVYSGERIFDPGDEALLAEAAADSRVFLTKDHDTGALVHRSLKRHAGVLLLDDLGDANAETDLILSVLATHGPMLASGAFVRVTATGVRMPGV